MRLLLTGSLGFVAPHVVAALRGRLGDRLDLLATSREGTPMADGTPTTALDITSASEVDSVVAQFRPTHTVHLAGVTTLASAATDPNGAWTINVFGTLNIARSLIAHAAGSVLLFTGTGQSYGETARRKVQLSEDDVLAPNNDYGVTKTAADLALGAMAGRGVTMLRMRPFNHTGPGQTPTFVIPSFADQIAQIEAGKIPPLMRVGNLDVGRDFLDVRDVADAYALALLANLPSGTVLNVASGSAPTVRSMLDTLLNHSSATIAVETDPARVRAGEIEVFAGSSARARELLGWQPRIALAQTLKDVLTDARKRHGLL